MPQMPPPAAMPVPPPLDPKLWQSLAPEQQMHLLNLLKGMGAAQPEGTPFYGMQGQPVGPQNLLPPGERPAAAQPLRF